jgi:hypothetical protein
VQHKSISSSHFVDLASYRKVEPAPGGPYGNVIKAGCVALRGKQKIEVFPEAENKPVVLLRKDGDIVEGVEFVCRCGRSTAIQFDYEGE